MQEQNIFVLKERKEIAGHKQNDFQQVDSNWNALESIIISWQYSAGESPP